MNTNSEKQQLDMDTQLRRILRMMNFLHISQYELPKYGVSWPPDIARHGDDIRVYFGSNSQMFSIVERTSEVRTTAVYVRPTSGIVNRCYHALVGDSLKKVEDKTITSNVHYASEVMLQFFGLQFLGEFNYYGHLF